MERNWIDDPLGYLIGAERTGSFMDSVYEREALVAAHNEPDRFTPLISIDAIDRLISQVDLREGQLDLADASKQIGRSDYVDDAGLIDRGAVADFHRGGATIIMQHAHQLEPTLGRFCRALEWTFSAHAQTNLYLTPPNAQGFRTHYDNHCVFVAQVAGEKLWRIYEKPIDTPFRGEGFEPGVYQSGELKQEFVLKAGDCAYVPRGLMHDAATSGTEPSLHITVGLITRTWADLLLEAVSEVALRTPELRRSLPAGYARPGFDREQARTQLRSLAERVAADIRLDDALDLIADAFRRGRGADNRFAIRDAAISVRGDDGFVAQSHLHFRLAEDGETLVLIAPGGEIKFKHAQRPAVERALSGQRFTPNELGGDDPEGLAAKLLAYGLIVRASA